MNHDEKRESFAYFSLMIARFAAVKQLTMTLREEICMRSAVDAMDRDDVHGLEDALDAMGWCACGRAPFVCVGPVCEPITMPSESFLPDDVRETCEAWVEAVTAPLAGDS